MPGGVAVCVAPSFTRLGAQYTEPMILDYIVSVNTRRRHLSAGQRAMLALEYEAACAKAAKQAQREAGRKAAEKANAKVTGATVVPDPVPEQSGRSAVKAAQATGASRTAVIQAKAIQRDAPDLAEKVRSGQLALDAADRQRKARIAAMPKPEPATIALPRFL